MHQCSTRPSSAGAKQHSLLPASGASARVDVRAAYAPYCKEYKDNKCWPSPK
jgi:hypothetical protein